MASARRENRRSPITPHGRGTANVNELIEVRLRYLKPSPVHTLIAFEVSIP